MTSKISVVISDAHLNALRSLAASRQLSLSDVIREMIRQALEGRCS